MEELQLSIKSIVEQGTLFYNVPVTYMRMKRLFDIVASMLAIIILSPIILIAALAIKLESRGPIFFIQKRNGLRGEMFQMYKFRSMITEAEEMLTHLESKNEASGHMFKIKDDPRITRIGRIIRKTSIDEIPQFFNVLKGDMSIVGPRPPIMREVVKYDAWHKLRLSVKPGLTGLWQVSGRSNIGFEEMVRLDLKYIRERNFLYDLKMILKTIPVLLGDSKAF